MDSNFNRDKILALSSGLVLGFLMAFSGWRLDNGLKEEAYSTPPLSLAAPAFTLELFPKDKAVVEESEINLTGKTHPGAHVLVLAEEIQETKAGTSGLFSVPLKLTEGPNKVLVTAINDHGVEVEKEIVINLIRSE